MSTGKQTPAKPRTAYQREYQARRRAALLVKRIQVELSGDDLALFERARLQQRGPIEGRSQAHDVARREVRRECRNATGKEIQNAKIFMMTIGIPPAPPDANDSWQIGRQRMPDNQGKLEAVAACVWKEYNKRTCVNYGHGTAQDLMLGIQKYEKPEGFDPWLTERERHIMGESVAVAIHQLRARTAP